MKSLLFSYAQGTLLSFIEGPFLIMKAEMPGYEVEVKFREWALLELRGALELAFHGKLNNNYTIQGEGGYVVLVEKHKNGGERQVSLRIGKEGDEERVVIYLLPPASFKLMYLCDRVIEKYSVLKSKLVAG